MPALLFDLYGVLLRVQDPEHLARIEEASGHSGEAFWSAYWDCRPDYDAGLVSTHGYWSRVADRLDAPIRDVADAHEQDMASWLAGDPQMIEYVTGLADAGARTALLSNIPVPLAERVLAAHSWLQHLDPCCSRGGSASPSPTRASSSTRLGRWGCPPVRCSSSTTGTRMSRPPNRSGWPATSSPGSTGCARSSRRTWAADAVPPVERC